MRAPLQPRYNPAGSGELEKYHTRATLEYNRARFSLHKTGEKTMMMDWNQYHKEVSARIGDLMKVSPDTVRGYQTLSAANSKTSKLGEKRASSFRWP